MAADGCGAPDQAASRREVERSHSFGAHQHRRGLHGHVLLHQPHDFSIPPGLLGLRPLLPGYPEIALVQIAQRQILPIEGLFGEVPHQLGLDRDGLVIGTLGLGGLLLHDAEVVVTEG